MNSKKKNQANCASETKNNTEDADDFDEIAGSIYAEPKYTPVQFELLKDLYFSYQSGHKHCLPETISYCFERKIPVPTWASKAFVAIQNKILDGAEFIDWNKAFKSPTATRRDHAQRQKNLGVLAFQYRRAWIKKGGALSDIGDIPMATLLGIGKETFKKLVKACESSIIEWLAAHGQEPNDANREGLAKVICSNTPEEVYDQIDQIFKSTYPAGVKPSSKP